MATRKAANRAPQGVQDDAGKAPIDEFEHLERQEQAELGEAIAAFASELGEDQSDAQIKVFRKMPGGGKEFCDAYPIAEFGGETLLLKRIREEWGPGNYNISLSHNHRWIVNRDIKIAPEPGGSSRVKVDQFSELARQIDASRAETARMIADAINGMKEVMRAAAPPAVDPNVAMKQTLEILSAARSIFGPEKSVAQQLGEITGVLELGKQIRGLAASEDGGGEDLLTKLAPQAMGLIEKAVAAQANNRPHQLPAPRPPANMPAANPAPQASPQGDNVNVQQMTEEQRELLGAISMLNSAAAFGLPAERFADDVYEKAPDEFIEMLADPAQDWFEVLAQQVPSIRPHEVFYRALGKRVMEIDAEEQAKESAAGDAKPAAVPKAA